MDLNRAYSEVKSLPDDALMNELRQPTGMMPGYLVLSEMHERKALRSAPAPEKRSSMADEIKARGYASGGMVGALNPFITLTSAMRQRGRLDKTPDEAAGGSPPFLPTLEAATALDQLRPLAPGTPTAPKAYAKGGAVHYDVGSVERYIRQAAAARGIDPDIAVKVARSEGLGPGIWQSNFAKGGHREPSYGPYQLLVGGPGTGYGTGLGNAFMKKTGLDPRDPSTVYKQVDFALDNAKTGGWGPWYGAKRVGLGNWAGINGKASGPMPVAPTMAAAANVNKAATAAGLNSLTPTATVAATPKSPLGGLAGLMAMTAMMQEEPTETNVETMRPSQFTRNVDPKLVAEETSPTPDYYRKRRHG